MSATSVDISRLADFVAQGLGSKSVLDIGATKDRLPAILAARGIHAVAGDLDRAEALLGQTECDLIVAIGLADELSEDDVRASISRMRRLGSRILVATSGPASGVSGGQASRWSRLFAEHGFAPEEIPDIPGAGPSTMLFVRRLENAGEPTSSATRDEALRREIQRLWQALEERDSVIVDLMGRLMEIEGTVTWRLREAARRLAARRPRAGRLGRVAYLAWRTCDVLIDEGVLSAGWKAFSKLRRLPASPADAEQSRVPEDLNAQYQLWLRRHGFSGDDRRRATEEAARFAHRPVVSIVMPRRPGDGSRLQEAIDSVRDQVYPQWELIVVGGDSTVGEDSAARPVEELGDPRIRLVSSDLGLARALTRGVGEYVGWLGPDDRLAPEALFEVVVAINQRPVADVVYTDEDQIDEGGRRSWPFFKPDWSPDLLLSLDYVSRFCVASRGLLEQVLAAGRADDECDPYDLVLRLTERAREVAHVPKVLYHRRTPTEQTADGARAAVVRALERRGWIGRVEAVRLARPVSSCRVVRYALRGRPLVSIVIPTRDRGQLLRLCLQSIADKTDYPAYEVIVLDNETTEPETLKYLDSVAGKVRVHRFPGPFNYAAVNNFGARQGRGEQILFLNNDIQVINRDWLTAMVEHAQRREVGAVGAKLLYPNGRIQHAGVVLGVSGLAGHAFKDQPDEAPGYFGLPHVIRNCSAVTGACMLVRRDVFDEVGGFDEGLKVEFNDVDLCLRIRRLGYLIVYTPVARLYHFEGASRRRIRPPEDEQQFRSRWRDAIEGADPYYNANLTRSRDDWSLRL